MADEIARLLEIEEAEPWNTSQVHSFPISVLFSDESKPIAATFAGAFAFGLPVNEADIKRIYGRPGEINIYTEKN
jgi:hypothetical protein